MNRLTKLTIIALILLVLVESMALWILWRELDWQLSFNRPVAHSLRIPIPDPTRFLAPDRYRAWVMESCAEFGVPLDVGIRLIYEESGWDEKAMHRNRDGSYDHNLTQLNSRWHRVMLTRAAIREGIRYWAQCWHRLGTIRAATIAYQTGPNAMYRATKRTLAEADHVSKGDL